MKGVLKTKMRFHFTVSFLVKNRHQGLQPVPGNLTHDVYGNGPELGNELRI